ncbi:2-isopropylmalate synthase (plasmid) [Buchnera aphidicola (Neophyllaphis varicolor)]|uniref:2-isopropylmalate synthase n=1 Tax=Buchnera aphidicola TaxID=9 RepID=UPI0031B85E46
MKNRIIILDTTLRDGEQSLKSSLNTKEKIEIALSLEKLGIDILELGFPISSPQEFNSIKEISKIIKNSTICSLARCVEKDIDIAAKAMKSSNNFRIHIFLATSYLHIKSKLQKTFEEIVQLSINAIKIAKKYTDDIEFSCEDAGRTSIDNLCYIVEKLINEGVKTINIPDTVGFTIPSQFGDIIKNLFNRVPNIDKAIISVHCHNDLGMAVANSIAAIQNGAKQIEGTILGIGERAGNTSIEEVCMAIKIRKDLLKFKTNINHKYIYRTSKLVSKICKIKIPSNKAIIGNNAFSHSSGIHQDGIIKNRKNYEIINPESIGIETNRLNLTSRSGRAAIKYKMKEMGYKKEDYDLNQLYDLFIKLADKKGQIFDYDLENLAFLTKEENESHFYKLINYEINFIYSNKSKFLIKFKHGKKTKKIELEFSNNFIYSLIKLFNRTMNINIKICNYEMNIKNKEKKEICSINIKVEYESQKFYEIIEGYDMWEISIKSIFNILNNIKKKERLKKIKLSKVNLNDKRI